jgi:hypothetical protein
MTVTKLAPTSAARERATTLAYALEDIARLMGEGGMQTATIEAKRKGRRLRVRLSLIGTRRSLTATAWWVPPKTRTPSVMSLRPRKG